MAKDNNGKSMSTSEFMDSTKSRNSDIIRWREDGQIVGFIHPKSGIFERRTYYLDTVVKEKDKDGEIVKSLKRKIYICPGIDNGCPICEFREFLRENQGIEDDEIVYSTTFGKKEIEMAKGDALGIKGYDWKNTLVPSKEYVFGFIDVDNIEAGVGAFIAPTALGRAITAVIEERIESKGADKGDPLKKPYAFKFKYDEKAKVPADKYKAFYNDAEITEEIQELIDDKTVSIKGLTTAAKPSEIWDVIGKNIKVEGFEPSFLTKGEDVEEEVKEDAEEDEAPKKKIKHEEEEEEETPKKKIKHEEEEEEEEPPKKKKKVDEEEETPEEEEEEEKPKKKIKHEEESSDDEEKKEDDEEEETTRCPSCGKRVPLSAKTCPKCGLDFVADEDSPPKEKEEKEEEEEEETPKKKKKLICKCGEELDPDDRRCPSCGKKVIKD